MNRTVIAAVCLAVLLAANFGCLRAPAPTALAENKPPPPGQEADTNFAEPHIEIVGSVRFSNQVHEALLLLQTKAPDDYRIVIKYIGRIQQGDHSGMWAYKRPPTYEMA